ncbi:MAG TPA: NAD(+)/NADH kinase [Thermoplasmata archaeon]|nr:NAD(+)/NADH kinase [Thermoplasmata archaeon]
MRIGIVAHPNKPLALGLARRARARFEGKADVVLAPECHDAVDPHAAVEPIESMRADALVALGGDGTFLMTLQRSSVPLLPVNTGTVGFLAEVEGDHTAEFDRALDRLLEGRYQLEERMRVACQVNGKTLPDAINEVVVHTSNVAKMRLFEIAIDGRAVGRIRADGMIVATPTGSTSYSLSAMGPIVDPSIEALVVSSLAPFQSTPRAVVVDPLRTVGIRLVLPGKGGVVVVDGQAEEPVEPGGMVTCYRSPRKAVFIRFERRYFERLQGKHILPWPELSDDGGGRGGPDLPPTA